mmetsp:Transcript_21248/g.59094  ORF Transcript_21248/g.59094 Transcript_21248/m.59094 type:complete len:221 (-) Transcript_21248:480-1142(-)
MPRSRTGFENGRIDALLHFNALGNGLLFRNARNSLLVVEGRIERQNAPRTFQRIATLRSQRNRQIVPSWAPNFLLLFLFLATTGVLLQFVRIGSSRLRHFRLGCHWFHFLAHLRSQRRKISPAAVVAGTRRAVGLAKLAELQQGLAIHVGDAPPIELPGHRIDDRTLVGNVPAGPDRLVLSRPPAPETLAPGRGGALLLGPQNSARDKIIIHSLIQTRNE